MNYQYPDRISVEESDEVEVVPKHASLVIVIEGESSVLLKDIFDKESSTAVMDQYFMFASVSNFASISLNGLHGLRLSHDFIQGFYAFIKTFFSLLE